MMVTKLGDITTTPYTATTNSKNNNDGDDVNGTGTITSTYVTSKTGSKVTAYKKNKNKNIDELSSINTTTIDLNQQLHQDDGCICCEGCQCRRQTTTISDDDKAIVDGKSSSECGTDKSTTTTTSTIKSQHETTNATTAIGTTATGTTITGTTITGTTITTDEDTTTTLSNDREPIYFKCMLNTCCQPIKNTAKRTFGPKCSGRSNLDHNQQAKLHSRFCWMLDIYDQEHEKFLLSTQNTIDLREQAYLQQQQATRPRSNTSTTNGTNDGKIKVGRNDAASQSEHPTTPTTVSSITTTNPPSPTVVVGGGGGVEAEADAVAKAWKESSVPLGIRILSRFSAPYPFTLDPTRKFLRSVFNMSKVDIYQSDSPNGQRMKQLRGEYIFYNLFIGLMNKKRQQIRKDSRVRIQLAAKPDRSTVLKPEETITGSTNQKISGIADLLIQCQLFGENDWNDQYLVRVLPLNLDVAKELEDLVIQGNQRDTKIACTLRPNDIAKHQLRLLQESLDGIERKIVTRLHHELDAHYRYREHNPDAGRNVTSLMVFMDQIGTLKDQTIFWFFVMSDEQRWNMSPVIKGIVSLQQVLLSIMCGGNIFLDFMSMARRPQILRTWAMMKMLMDPHQYPRDLCKDMNKANLPVTITTDEETSNVPETSDLSTKVPPLQQPEPLNYGGVLTPNIRQKLCIQCGGDSKPEDDIKRRRNRCSLNSYDSTLSPPGQLCPTCGSPPHKNRPISSSNFLAAPTARGQQHHHYHHHGGHITSAHNSAGGNTVARLPGTNKKIIRSKGGGNNGSHQNHNTMKDHPLHQHHNIQHQHHHSFIGYHGPHGGSSYHHAPPGSPPSNHNPSVISNDSPRYFQSFDDVHNLFARQKEDRNFTQQHTPGPHKLNSSPGQERGVGGGRDMHAHDLHAYIALEASKQLRRARQDGVSNPTDGSPSHVPPAFMCSNDLMIRSNGSAFNSGASSCSQEGLYSAKRFDIDAHATYQYQQAQQQQQQPTAAALLSWDSLKQAHRLVGGGKGGGGNNLNNNGLGGGNLNNNEYDWYSNIPTMDPYTNNNNKGVTGGSDYNTTTTTTTTGNNSSQSIGNNNKNINTRGKGRDNNNNSNNNRNRYSK